MDDQPEEEQETMEDKTGDTKNILSTLEKSLSRRQVLRAGGFAALGLVFLPPRINTLRPQGVGHVVSPIGRSSGGGGNTFALPCTAFIDLNQQASGIRGIGIDGEAVRSGDTNTYDLDLSYDCGACSDGTCLPSIGYQWAAVSTTALGVQISNQNSASADVTPTLNLGISSLGLAQYLHRRVNYQYACRPY